VAQRTPKKKDIDVLYQQYVLRSGATDYTIRQPKLPGSSETVQAAQHRAAEAIRDAALSFRGESLLIVGHKHINALLMCALLKEPLTGFASHIVEDALPCLLPADAVETLCFGGGLYADGRFAVFCRARISIGLIEKNEAANPLSIAAKPCQHLATAPAPNILG
jgi:Histidine phosphatase superfamily (branch 1)